MPASEPIRAFRFRPLDPDTDLARLLRLFHETEAVDQTGEHMTEEDVRHILASPNYNLAEDIAVVEDPADPDHLVAQSAVWRPPTAERAGLLVQVHPAWRRRGIGSALLEGVVARARAKGARYLLTDVDERQTAGAAFLWARDFVPISTEVEMRAPADVPLDRPAWPVGYIVRSYSEIGQIALLLDALNKGFVGHFEHRDFEHRDLTEAELAQNLAAPHLRPDGIFLAFDPAGAVAGVCWAEISPSRGERRGESTGYINSLAVVPAHRRAGLGRALLLHAMRWLRANGQGPIELDVWGANERALPLYTGTGFAVTAERTTYRRDL